MQNCNGSSLTQNQHKDLILRWQIAKNQHVHIMQELLGFGFNTKYFIKCIWFKVKEPIINVMST